MRYAIHNGELPTQVLTEYHIVSSSGMVAHIFDDERLARQRFKNFGVGCHLVRVDKKIASIAVNRPPKAQSHLHLAISA